MATKPKPKVKSPAKKKRAKKETTLPQIKSDYPIKLVKKKLSELRHASYNPRSMGPLAFDGLNKSIETFGYVDPIIINKRTGNIVGGHRRFDVLINQAKGKNPTVDVVEIDIDETREKALNVTLNNHHIQGQFNTEKLQIVLEEIKIDLPEFESIQLDRLEVKPIEVKTPKTSESNGGCGESDKSKKQEYPEKCPQCGYKLK